MSALAGLLGSLAYKAGDNLLGRPFQLWARVVDAENEARVRAGGYRGNERLPNATASPDAIITAWKAGLLSANVACAELLYTGVYPPLSIVDRITDESLRRKLGRIQMDIDSQVASSRFWENMSVLSASRPSPDTVAQLLQRGRVRAQDIPRLQLGHYADWRAYRIAVDASYQMPGADELRQLLRRKAITRSSYELWMRRLGWTNPRALELFDSSSALPTVGELIVAGYRGLVTGPVMEDWRRALGYVDDDAWRVVTEANRPYPSTSDLVMFAVREVWDTNARQRLGYDLEFPEPFRYWMSKQGMDWGQGFTDSTGKDYPAVNWPLAYWIAHWQPMSPTQAYRAYHLFRPDQMDRYRDVSPGITPFTIDDLHAVLKVADYPEPIRKWLAGIAVGQLRLTDIRGIYRTRRRDREWAVNRLMDRGYVRDDAESAVSLWDADEQLADLALRRSLRRRATTEAIREVRSAYGLGILDHTAAKQRLADLKVSASTASRMLALEDARLHRQQATAFLNRLRKSYLRGAMSDAEAIRQLTAAGFAPQRSQQYLAQWNSELTAERRALTTQQIAQAVATGELGPAEAGERLTRLGWSEADRALLLAQAGERLTARQARAAQAEARSAGQRARAVQAAQRQATAALRSSQRQLRSIYPIATLRRQYCLGIRKGGTILSLLESMGYGKDARDNLLKQWAMECEAHPPVPEKRVGSLESYLRRQTPESLLKQWWQRGVTTDQWTRQRLAAIGLEPGAIEARISLWARTKGRKSGPAPEGTPPPAPLS